MTVSDHDSGPVREALPAYAAAAALLREQFEALLPAIQRQWPEVARQTLEATRGSLEPLVQVITEQTGRTSELVRAQLLELAEVTTHQAHHLVDALQPLEEQLEHLLDDLNTTLRPRIERPVRARPLLSIGVAAGVGLLLGLVLASGRRSR
jgi:ElaB/YqjD/DUF883 family membrane-anchored ribosome-binding protein